MSATFILFWILDPAGRDGLPHRVEHGNNTLEDAKMYLGRSREEHLETVGVHTTVVDQPRVARAACCTVSVRAMVPVPR